VLHAREPRLDLLALAPRATGRRFALVPNGGLADDGANNKPTRIIQGERENAYFACGGDR
jgi:hypothetical protein